MDRRFLLAMVLSTLVVVVFYTWFIPAPRQTAAPPRAAHDTLSGARPAGDSTLTSGRPDSTFIGTAFDTSATPAAPVQTFVIDTPRALATFSTRGGGIQSWKLKQFEGAAPGQPVELVLGEVEPGVVLDLGGRRLDLGRAVFQSDRRPGPDGSEDLRFTAGLPGGIEVVKHFTVRPGTPLVDFELEVRGVPANVADAAIEVGWRGLPRAERTPRPDKMAFGAVVSLGQDIERVPAGRFKKERTRRFEGAVHWVGVRNKYFLVSLIPPEGAATVAITGGDAAADRAGAAVRLPVVSGAASRLPFKLYLGPLDYWKLKDVGFGLERSVDLGWKFILPLSHALLWLLVHGYRAIPNYGVVIIILSALTKVLFYPMTRSSMRSMQAMQKLQPEMERIRKKYKDDPQRLNQEVMNLYRNNKVNPVGGCLPLLLQMPVFIALYTVLANSVELRHAYFFLWIRDLSSPDTLMRVGGFEVHVLPILMGASMFWQQKLTPTDPRQAGLTYIMPFMMLFFFYGFPSGLALYWTVTNLLSVAQQHLINRERGLGGPGSEGAAGPHTAKKLASSGAVAR